MFAAFVEEGLRTKMHVSLGIAKQSTISVAYAMAAMSVLTVPMCLTVEQRLIYVGYAMGLVPVWTAKISHMAQT
jgi:hypothetical protein